MTKSSNKKTKNVNLEKLRSSVQLDLKQVDLAHIINCEIENFGLQLGLFAFDTSSSLTRMHQKPCPCQSAKPNTANLP